MENQVMTGGRYWVGDLCYVLGDQWDEAIRMMYPDDADDAVEGRHVLSNGVAFSYHGTAFGDGVYSDKQGRLYSVDAGLIGCVALADIPKDALADAARLGHFVDFHGEFTSRCEDGVIHFGNVVQIDTNPEDEEGE